MRAEHELKCLPEYFSRIQSGQKTFEIRKNDRDFQVGDILILKEHKPSLERDFYPQTVPVFQAEIVYMTSFEQKEGYVVLGIRPYEFQPSEERENG